MRLLLIAGLSTAILLAQGHAADRVWSDTAWSYTMEEMYDRAASYKLVAEGTVPKDTKGMMEAAVKAAEFKGYVAATLDNGNTDRHDACAKRLPVDVIARRTAILITSTPLDRSQVAAAVISLTILYACDESSWRKPTEGAK